MGIAERTNISSNLTARDDDGLIILGYAIFAIVALVAIYLSAGGPGLSESDLVTAVIMP
jgi:hypothetical protein